MTEFFETALTFPAVLFSFALVVVAGYWLLLLVGGVGLDLLDSDDAASGSTGPLAAIGLGGVPVTIALSLIITLAWVVSFIGVVLLSSFGGLRTVLSIVVLAVALLAGVLGTRLAAAPLSKLFAKEKAQSRDDFVGKICIVRTGTVGEDFGQAEITSEDGSSAVIQVRQSNEHLRDNDPLHGGDSALIYHYDGEVFWVCPPDPALGPSSDPTN